MKSNFLFSILTLFCIHIAHGNDWVGQKISGAVTVYFPQQPQRSDTAHQNIYFLNEGKEYLVASAMPIPDSIQPKNEIQADSILSNFIQSVILDATPLIYTDVEFQNIPAKYYSVRMDNEKNPAHGLIVDSYTLIYLDTIYSFSFFRYNATQLYNYNKQRKFFDMIEIAKNDATLTSTDSLLQNLSPTTAVKTSRQSYTIWIFISIVSSFILLSISWYWFKKKSKQ